MLLAGSHFGHGQGGHVHQPAHGGRRRHDVRGEGAAQQDRADGDAVPVGGLEYVEQDVGRIQVRAHQQVGVAIQRAVGHQAVTQFRQQGGVAVHLAVAVDVRGHAAEDVARLAHLDGRRAA